MSGRKSVLFILLATLIVAGGGQGAALAGARGHNQAGVRVGPASAGFSAPEETAALAAVADAYVDSAHPFDNYGGLDTLRVGRLSTSQAGRTLVQFDLSTLGGATVQAASLRLFRTGGSASPATLYVCVERVLGEWAEMAVNWDSQPPSASIGKCNPVGMDLTYYDWDVTGLVRDWVSGAVPNFGVLLRSEPESTAGWRGFASRETAPSPPRLMVQYSPTILTDDPQVQGLRRLQANSTVPVRFRFRNGIPAYVHAQVPAGGPSGDPFAQARAFLAAYQDLFRLADPNAQFRLESQTTEGDRSRIVLQQMYNGVPVYGARVGIHLKGGLFTGSNGAYLPDLDISMLPGITPSAAEQAAIADVLSHVSGISVRLSGSTALVVFDRSLWSDAAPDPRLAWRVNVANAGAWAYFVDAQSGAVLHRLTMDETALDLEVLGANGNSSLDCWENQQNQLTLWYDETGAQVPVGQISQDGQNAFAFAPFVYNYYDQLMDRQSFDDRDHQVRLLVNVNLGPLLGGPNSVWRGRCEHIEFSTGWVVQDVVGHEFTHGVVQHTEFNPEYEGEPGALDESLSDTFGEFIEDYATGSADWLVGAGMANGPLRSLADPPSQSTNCAGNVAPDPDYYSPPMVYNCDNGGVHIMSGIPNKAAWLIASDVTNVHYGIPVNGIGIDRAGSIFYRALRDHLLPNSDFMAMREAMMEAAEELFGDDEELCTVRNAYAAVGLGIADTDCDGDEDPADTDDDNDGDLDDDDNCPLIANPNQLDLDGDGLGDVCDPDRDDDVIVNGEDNCPDAWNPNQYDQDGDGAGEVCDDDDEDGVPNAFDNCPDVHNPDQANHDSDTLGDLCDDDDDNDGILDDGDGSGAIGDNYCRCGDTTDCDDNAPINYNPNQADPDCDGVGEIVDNCPGLDNPYIGGYPPVQQDNDRDGVGDDCDDDDDNDGIPDPEDNCQYHPNPDQINIDLNDLGLACDQGEAFMLSAEAQRFAFFIKFGDMSGVDLPIFPCWADGCPEGQTVYPAGQRAVVSLAMPKAFGVAVRDDAGSLVTSAGRGVLNPILSFPVHPSYRFDFGTMAPLAETRARAAALGDTARYAQRPLYYLELWPTQDTVIGQTYQVQFDMSSAELRPWVYLPLIQR